MEVRLISSHDRTCQSRESNNVCSLMFRTVGFLDRSYLIGSRKQQWAELVKKSWPQPSLAACLGVLCIGDHSAVTSQASACASFPQPAKGRRGCLYRYSLLSQGIACSLILYPLRRKASLCLQPQSTDHTLAQRRYDHGSRTTLASRPSGKFL
jgi:hypothetical protein